MRFTELIDGEVGHFEVGVALALDVESVRQNIFSSFGSEPEITIISI
jgi:hypothetical protein